MPHILISVTNDLSTDQRVKKICDRLVDLDYQITLIGRRLKNSKPILRSYKTIRMRLLFNNGFFFYAEYNLRLFLRLLYMKKDILLANDLDTLLPNFLVSKICSKKIVYDSHELFTEVPELMGRPRVRQFWLMIEKFIFPKLKNVYTVNQSIATHYQKKYGIDVKVVRNVSEKLKNEDINPELSQKVKGEKKMIILQGSGINIDRGAEEAVLMMDYLENTILYIIGGGDVFEGLKKIVKEHYLEDKVTIKNKMPYQELLEYTKIADLGLSLDKGTNLNYEYSLPNKIFDYMQCLIPILATNRLEVGKIIKKNNIGFVCDTSSPKELAKIVNSILNNQELLMEYKNNLKIAADKYTWEKESQKIKKIFSSLN